MAENKTIAFPDLDFDALPDLPGFSVPPAGSYKLKMTLSMKEINKKSAVEAEFEVVELLEQADPTEAPAKIGDKFSSAFFLDNQFGLGKLKETIAPLKDFFGTGSLAAIAEQCQGLSIAGTVKVRSDKNDAEKKYASVSNIIVD